MKNKGFTLVEILVVIAIIGVITGIATISITRNRKTVDEKEIKLLRQNIISSFDMYRIERGIGYNVVINIQDTLKTSTKFSYSGKKCDELSNSTIKVFTKGSYDGSASKEELYCIKFYCNGILVIDDFNSLNYCQ